MENRKGLIMALIGVLIVGLAIVSFLLFRSHSANQEMQQLFEVEKEEMENEYSNFANQYDELQIKINNDSLYQKLEQEKLKTQRLLEELRQVKSSNAAEIMRLRKELKTVRAVMRTYIIQIDSLNRINQQLTSENQSVKKKYNEATQQISSLSEEKKTLNEKVTLASQLDATHITVTPTNKRGKKTDRIKRITRLDISFTVVKNITAETGQRTLYVRITKPNQEVLTKSAANTFPYENRNIAYSIKKYIEYTGEEQNVTVYWNVEEFLQAGTYRVDIFADGNLIGSQTFDLD
ncbi:MULTISPECIES: hypothetical protein [Bacteroidaceae]|uniref:hypothetical protein n=1 Tax=Bacteroidaceae TaxID=815 RepID=UPI000339CFFE|nr:MULTISPECIES: hypothetical protein [Bacteroidaceae]MCL1606311.1 hypothetical protein [Mediterranea sp. ET5]MDM8121353.1 hypothetical protein [Mediterranea massiliensis]MDM8198111.1 hypothetical protein [Mediterranea massiliensis]CDD82728.1 uncharacterized protein BN666_00152 [Bacteroides sp. CAG:462]